MNALALNNLNPGGQQIYNIHVIIGGEYGGGENVRNMGQEYSEHAYCAVQSGALHEV
jgi:hypothetical protein